MRLGPCNELLPSPDCRRSQRRCVRACQQTAIAAATSAAFVAFMSALVSALGSEVKLQMPQGTKAPLPPNEDADNPLYKEDNFRMWCLKVLPCSKRYCHDWTTCPWAHAQEKAKRRDPRVYNYTGVACPEMKKSMQCPRGDQCPYAHNVFEYWLHHSRYRTQLCNDGVGCKRKICFFAHTLDELRVSSVKVQVPPDFRGEVNSNSINPFAPSNPSSAKHTATPRSAGNNNNNNSQAGLSMAELQQLGALQAKLQAAQQGMGAADPGAFDQLVQLMVLAQQQQAAAAAAGSAMMAGDPMQQLMAQMMLGQQQQAMQQQQQQQQQAAAQMAQMQQQMAALQLLGQMQGLSGYNTDPYNSLPPMSTTGTPQDLFGMPPRFPQQGPNMGGYQGNPYPHQQQQDPVDSAVDALARQLSGLSASGALQSPPAPYSDAPNSARSYASGSTPSAGRHHSMRLMRQHTHDGVNVASAPIGMGVKHPASDMASSHGRSTIMQHTSPVSVSALGDGYTTATANSYFSASHSLSSSQDGSDLECPAH